MTATPDEPPAATHETSDGDAPQTPPDGPAPEEPRTQPEPTNSEPENIAPPLTVMIASIRSALAPNASPQARSAGATAARSILTVLDAKPGQPLTPAPPASTRPPSPLAALFSQPSLNRLAAMSREELISLLKQVTGVVSPRPQPPAVGAPRFHLIEIPSVRRPDGGR